MAKVDRIKEEIGWLKVVFAILFASDASLVGWLAQNCTTASWPVVLVGAAVGAVVTLVVALVNRLAYRRIDQLENA